MISGKVLVTGGVGFIGSHIVNNLLKLDGIEKIIVLDNLSSGKIENLGQNLRNDRLKFIKGDIRSNSLVQRVVKDVDYIFHEAAIVNVEVSIRKPKEVNDVNVNGTLNLLHASLGNKKLKRIVFASSCAVYGDPEKIPIDENCRTCPISPYGASKLAAELYMKVFYKVYGLPTVSLRYFNVFGPGQEANPYSGVISIFVYKALKGEPITIFGDGEQTRDFVYIDDIVKANLLAASNEKSLGEVFNIGSGTEITIKDLASKIIDISGREKIDIVYGPSRSGDIRRSLANIEKARRILGYEPRTNIENNLVKVFEYFRDHVGIK